MSAPKPTRAQASAEKRLRDLGVTVTFTPSGSVPHGHAEFVRQCVRCQIAASAERINDRSPRWPPPSASR